MKSPFPGMDPYLEAHWGDVQTSLATYVKDQLNHQLPGDLLARVQSSVAVEADDARDDEVITYYPDVQVAPADDLPGRRATAAGLATEPVVLARSTEPQTLRSVRIVTADGHRLVTGIEILSPSNKVGETGREKFRAKEADILASKASVVEIDLIRAGRHVLSIGLPQLPQKYRRGYKAVVVRGWRQDKVELYPIGLRDRLPTVRVPLRKSDPDVHLDLQALIETVYENGRYGSMNYRGELRPHLAAEDEAWADDLLKKAGKR